MPTSTNSDVDCAIRLPAAVHEWGSARFEQTLKDAIERLDAGCLPLYRATSEGGRVDASDLRVSVLGSHEDGQAIEARVGVFFTEVVGGCSCGDDPFSRPGYCLLRVTIDRQTTSAGFEIMQTAGEDGL